MLGEHILINVMSFLWNVFIYHCLMLIFVSFYLLSWSLFCLIQVWLHLLSFVCHFLEYHLLSLHSELVFACIAEICFLEVAYCWLLYFSPSNPLCLLIGKLNPFTFRVIMDICGLNSVIYLLFSGFSIFLFIHFPCISVYHFTLVVLCDVFLRFLFFMFSTLLWVFVFCGYHEVCIKDLPDVIVLFLLRASISICLCRFHPFPLPLLRSCCHKLSLFVLCLLPNWSGYSYF